MSDTRGQILYYTCMRLTTFHTGHTATINQALQSQSRTRRLVLVAWRRVVEPPGKQNVRCETIAITRRSDTPSHLAALRGHTGVVGLLLGKGATIQAINTYNNTPLHLAAQGGHTGTVKLLLRKGALIEAITTTRGEQRVIVFV